MIDEYGFVADPNLTLNQNINKQIIHLSIQELCAPSKTLSYHNLSFDIPLPKCTKNLLGLGSKFCIEKRTPPIKLYKSFSRLNRSVRLKAFINEYLKQNKSHYNEATYNPKLYITSNFQPPRAPTNIEYQLSTFKEIIINLTNKLPTTPKYNLTKIQRKVLRKLKNNTQIVILDADKNLGITIMKQDRYIKAILTEHLNNTTVYEKLSHKKAHDIINFTHHEIKNTLIEHQNDLKPNEQLFFERSLHRKYKNPCFYGPPKLHKTFRDNFPKTRPVVAKINSFVEIISKYIDYYLSKLIPQVATYLKDSFTLIEELHDIPKPLPHSCLLLTADAISMYTNIHTDHGITTVEKYIHKHRDKLEPDFPTTLLIRLLTIVMKLNTFTFGESFYLQKQGTAMGTTCAVKYATIYCALHEEDTIIPKYKDNLFFFRRYIDDIFCIWNNNGPHSWKNFEQDLTFGILNWEVSKPLKTVNFLDITIQITNNYDIITKTFEKELNLHNYLPANSAHPPGTPKSLIIGFLTRYWIQNTKREDFIKQVQLFAQRLHRRGYTKNFIFFSILEASKYLQKKYKNSKKIKRKHKETYKDEENNTLFFHREFHPRGIPNYAIQDAYQRSIGKLCLFKQMTVCNSRPKNIRDILMPSKLNNSDK